MTELIAVRLFKHETEFTEGCKAPNAVVATLPRIGETVYVRDDKSTIVRGTVLNVIHELWRGQDKEGEVRITLHVRLFTHGIV